MMMMMMKMMKKRKRNEKKKIKVNSLSAVYHESVYEVGEHMVTQPSSSDALIINSTHAQGERAAAKSQEMPSQVLTN